MQMHADRIERDHELEQYRRIFETSLDLIFVTAR